MLPSPSTTVTIGVVALPLDGRGDVTGADKIATTVSKVMPLAEVKFAIFDPVCPYGYNKLPREELVRMISRQVSPEKEFLEKISSLSCVILYPTYKDAIPQVILDACKRHNIPMIRFRESGAGIPKHADATYYPLGVDEGECGIILPEELCSYYQEHRNDPATMRLRNLANLPLESQKLILGCSFSEEAITAFHSRSKLFGGYCRESSNALSFILTVVQLSFPEERGNDRIVIYIMNEQCHFNAYLDDTSYPARWKDLKRVAYVNQFRNIQITEGKTTKSLSFPQGPKTGTRTLHIIFSNLNGREAWALMKASEQESLATGEQSIWEQLALGKRIAIEFSYQRLNETRSYVKLSKSLNPILGHLFERSIIGMTTFEMAEQLMDRGMQAAFDFKVDENKLLFFKTLRSDPKMGQAWDQFIQCLHEKHQFRPHLERILTKEKKSTVKP